MCQSQLNTNASSPPVQTRRTLLRPPNGTRTTTIVHAATQESRCTLYAHRHRRFEVKLSQQIAVRSTCSTNNTHTHLPERSVSPIYFPRTQRDAHHHRLSPKKKKRGEDTVATETFPLDRYIRAGVQRHLSRPMQPKRARCRRENQSPDASKRARAARVRMRYHAGAPRAWWPRRARLSPPDREPNTAAASFLASGWRPRLLFFFFARGIVGLFYMYAGMCVCWWYYWVVGDDWGGFSTVLRGEIGVIRLRLGFERVDGKFGVLRLWKLW